MGGEREAFKFKGSVKHCCELDCDQMGSFRVVGKEQRGSGRRGAQGGVGFPSFLFIFGLSLYIQHVFSHKNWPSASNPSPGWMLFCL